MDGTPAGGENPIQIFISYRRADSGGWAGRLSDQLKERFGEENVFFDQRSLEPGVQWRKVLKERGSGSVVFIAVIGPSWAEIMRTRANDPEGDQVRDEIERALRRGSGVRAVIPALVLGAEMPTRAQLPTLGTVQQLLNRESIELRGAHWESDVAGLIERVAAIGSEPEPEPEHEPEHEQKPAAGDRVRPPAGEVPAADDAHCEELARLLLDEHYSIVPFLGPDANSGDRTESRQDQSEYLPDSEELTEYITTYFASQLGSSPSPADLAQTSQAVAMAVGEGKLHMALSRALPSTCPPGAVHRFLAAYPATMERLGFPDRYQLIVTTNYDDSLERAFKDAEEPYDLAVYMARGDNRGHFVHVPYDGKPEVVRNANSYQEFPIDESTGSVTGTVIVKVHGAVDSAHASYSWRDNYVVTEDDYIDYMRGDVESIVPMGLLSNLRRNSNFLFLGHSIRDWSLRVFLKRVFAEREGRLPNACWAIQREPSALDLDFWKRINVDLYTASLDDYVLRLGQKMAQIAKEMRPPT